MYARSSKRTVARERYIKVFDRTVLEAMEKVQARIEELRQAKVGPRQLQLRFGDPSSLRATDVAESPTGRGLSHFSTDWSTVGHQQHFWFCGKLLKANAGEVAQRLNAAVC